jgi:uncharacterized LabA/DUF88 family protein
MVFIDGSNLYHALKATYGTGKYDVVKLGRELAAGRSLVQINYYIAQVNRAMGEALYADQQRFFSRLKQVQEIRLWTGRMARTNNVWYEKGVDVQIATHLVAMAYRDEYDVAILVSGDGDLAPAVREVRRLGRIVENAMPLGRHSWHLLQDSSRFIPIDLALWQRCQP